jgi:hypothetical protein
MAALLNSSYFGGLSEYGVGFPSFGGGFLPDPACRQKSPSRVGYYDPTGPSISDFLNCELDHHGLPQGPQVVYNIIMPAGSLENDFFGVRKLCTGEKGGATAWHFHQTPFTAEAIAALGAGLLSVGTGGKRRGIGEFLDSTRADRAAGTDLYDRLRRHRVRKLCRQIWRTKWRRRRRTRFRRLA